MGPVFRPVGFDYRSKIANPTWRKSWDWGLFIGGAVPSLIFGVAFGNLILGVPFYFEDNLRPVYTGGFFELLNPFSLLAGVVSFSMLTFHGSHFLMIRTEGVIYERARAASQIFGAVMLLAFAAAGIWLFAGIPGYRITSEVVAGALPNPLDKTVEIAVGAWFDNYAKQPLTMLIPVLGFVGGILGMLFSRLRYPVAAFWSSAVSQLGIIGTAGVSMFPFIMPSSSDPRSSLTVWDSVSSHLTLEVMFWSAVIFTPIVISYTAWCYKMMSGKITTEYVEANDHQAY